MNQAVATLWTAFSGLRLLFVILDAVLFLIFCYALIKAFGVRPRFHADWRPKKRVMTLQHAVFHEKWDAIMKKFHAGSSDTQRVAIIEADALADQALQGMSMSGETMAERLMNLNAEEVPSLNRLWKAHRMRNDIVHTQGFGFTPQEAESALKDYEVFLRDVGAL